MAGIHPELYLVMLEAINVSPIDFGVPRDGGVRTADRQREMYNDLKIKTNCDGYDKVSNHQIPKGELYGKAVDFYAYVNHKASWERHHLAMVAATILTTANRLREEGKISIVLKWGGTFGSSDFNGWDYPHIEIV